MNTKLISLFLIVLSIFASCTKEVVKTPKKLIEKEEMVNIMYDLSLLEAVKILNPTLLDSLKINSNQYIFKKYKIDNVQFSQNNIYYAADYKEYKKMYEQVKLRLDKNVKAAETLIKIESKKIIAKKVAEGKLKTKKSNDSIKKAKLKKAREEDSIQKVILEKRKTQLEK